MPFSGASSISLSCCTFVLPQPLQPCPLWCDTTRKAAQQHATAPASALVFDMQSHKSIPSYITFWLEARFQLTEACDRALMALTHIFLLFLPLNHCWDSPIAPAPLCPFTPLSSHVGSQTWVGQAVLWRALAEQMTHKGNSWWLSSDFHSDKWHTAYRGANGKSMTLCCSYSRISCLIV